MITFTADERDMLHNFLGRILESHQGKSEIVIAAKKTGMKFSASYKLTESVWDVIRTATDDTLGSYDILFGRRALRVCEQAAKLITTNLAQTVLPEYDSRLAKANPNEKIRLEPYLWRAKRRLEVSANLCNKISRELSK